MIGSFLLVCHAYSHLHEMLKKAIIFRYYFFLYGQYQIIIGFGKFVFGVCYLFLIFVFKYSAFDFIVSIYVAIWFCLCLPST